MIRRRSKKRSVVLLGPRGSFSDIAAMRFKFKKNYKNSFEEIFRAVLKGKTDFGFVPIKNSVIGDIRKNAFLLKKFTSRLSRLKLNKKITQKVDICLAGRENMSFGDVKKIYVSLYAAAQCGKFLNKNFARVKKVFVSSTSKALQKASKEKRAAGIGSREGAKIFKLKILAPHIQDRKRNFTTFILFSKSRNHEAKSSIDKIRGKSRKKA